MGLELRRDKESVTMATRRLLVSSCRQKTKTLRTEACRSRTYLHVYKVLQILVDISFITQSPHEKLTDTYLCKQFPTLHRNRSFIPVFTRYCILFQPAESTLNALLVFLTDPPQQCFPTHAYFFQGKSCPSCKFLSYNPEDRGTSFPYSIYTFLLDCRRHMPEDDNSISFSVSCCVLQQILLFQFLLHVYIFFLHN